MGQPQPDPVAGHRAESERLQRLADFLGRFCPGIGEGRQPNSGAAELATGHDLADARARACRAAFDAIERLCVMSFNFTSNPPEMTFTNASKGSDESTQDGPPFPGPGPPD